MLRKIKEFQKRLVQNYKEEKNRRVAILYMILRLLVILCMIRELFMENYHNVFLCILTLILFVIPFLVQEKFKISIPSALEIIILLFIFSAEILGEIQNFYNIIPNWDTLLHTLNGFLAAAIGFSLIDILNRTNMFHITMSPIFVALVSFCFSMTVGVIWEFFEFATDIYFKTDMQKDTIITTISSVNLDGAGNFEPKKIENITKTTINYDDKSIDISDGYIDIGLIDTMEDLIVNFIGALIFSFLGYFYISNRDNKNYKKIENFIPKKRV